jgi:hypothetical protein
MMNLDDHEIIERIRVRGVPPEVTRPGKPVLLLGSCPVGKWANVTKECVVCLCGSFLNITTVSIVGSTSLNFCGGGCRINVDAEIPERSCSA